MSDNKLIDLHKVAGLFREIQTEEFAKEEANKESEFKKTIKEMEQSVNELDANWKKAPDEIDGNTYNGKLTYKRIGEYTYIVKDENGKEYKAEMGVMDDTQDNYSGDEVEKTMDQEGLAMLIRQAKMGAPVREGDLDEEQISELNVPNDKEKVKARIQKLMQMAKDARDAGDSNKAYSIERSSEMTALQQKLSKLGESDDGKWITPPDEIDGDTYNGKLSYKRVGEYTYIVKDENGKEHKAEMGVMDDTQDKYSGDEVEKTMDQEGLEMLIRQAKMGAPTSEGSVTESTDERLKAWVNKWSKYKGGNGDPLPQGWFKASLDSGVTTDGIEQSELDLNYEVDPLPITDAMKQEFIDIMGDDEEETMHGAYDIVFNEATSEDSETGTLQQLLKLAGLKVVTDADINQVEEYSNSPDEEYADADTQLNKMSGGINRPKAMPAVGNQGHNDLVMKLKKAYDNRD